MVGENRQDLRCPVAVDGRGVDLLKVGHELADLVSEDGGRPLATAAVGASGPDPPSDLPVHPLQKAIGEVPPQYP